VCVFIYTYIQRSKGFCFVASFTSCRLVSAQFGLSQCAEDMDL